MHADSYTNDTFGKNVLNAFIIPRFLIEIRS